MAKAGRLRCCVPFCNRTTGRTEFTEWLCGDHWMTIPKVYRMAYGRYAREWRRYGPERMRPEWKIAGARLWRWLKRFAIEKSAGI